MDMETDMGVLARCPELRRHRWTVDDYHRMADVGLLDPDARVELIEGEIVEMAPIGGPHIGVSIRLNHLLVMAVGDRARVSAANPVRLDPHSEPQPDFSVLRSRADYDTRPPRTDDVMLAIELSDTTLRVDTRVKRPLYARAGIPEYWIVNLQKRYVDVHRSPAGDDYAPAERKHPGDVVTIEALPDVTIAVSQILG